jgi:hypothetical protein
MVGSICWSFKTYYSYSNSMTVDESDSRRSRNRVLLDGVRWDHAAQKPGFFEKTGFLIGDHAPNVISSEVGPTGRSARDP